MTGSKALWVTWCIKGQGPQEVSALVSMRMDQAVSTHAGSQVLTVLRRRTADVAGSSSPWPFTALTVMAPPQQDTPTTLAQVKDNSAVVDKHSSPKAPHAAALVHPLGPHSVIHGALLRVPQGVIGCADLLEFLLRLCIVLQARRRC